MRGFGTADGKSEDEGGSAGALKRENSKLSFGGSAFAYLDCNIF
jgi:hypothetical protein